MSTCYKNFPRRLVAALLVMGVAMSSAQAISQDPVSRSSSRPQPMKWSAARVAARNW